MHTHYRYTIGTVLHDATPSVVKRALAIVCVIFTRARPPRTTGELAHGPSAFLEVAKKKKYRNKQKKPRLDLPEVGFSRLIPVDSMFSERNDLTRVQRRFVQVCWWRYRLLTRNRGMRATAVTGYRRKRLSDICSYRGKGIVYGQGTRSDPRTG